MRSHWFFLFKVQAGSISLAYKSEVTKKAIDGLDVDLVSFRRIRELCRTAFPNHAVATSLSIGGSFRIPPIQKANTKYGRLTTPPRIQPGLGLCDRVTSDRHVGPSCELATQIFFFFVLFCANRDFFLHFFPPQADHPAAHKALHVEPYRECLNYKPKPDFYLSAAKAPYPLYQELTDPALISYYEKPSTRKVLLEHGIIHPRDYEVIFGSAPGGTRQTTQETVSDDFFSPLTIFFSSLIFFSPLSFFSSLIFFSPLIFSPRVDFFLFLFNDNFFDSINWDFFTFFDVSVTKGKRTNEVEDEAARAGTAVLSVPADGDATTGEGECFVILHAISHKKEFGIWNFSSAVFFFL